MSTDESVSNNLITRVVWLYVMLASLLFSLFCYFTTLDDRLVYYCYIKNILINNSEICISNDSYQRCYNKKVLLDKQ